jgi:hypothetical protein
MTDMNKVSLDKLLSRDDKVDVSNGRLIITPASGKDVPANWLAENEPSIVKEIANLLNLRVYRYTSYSTGNYGKLRKGGVTLQFENILNGDEAFAILNAQLTRKRATKHGNVGAELPKGQFRVSTKHNFYKLWVSTDIKLPARISSFHDYMGKLKSLVFTGNLDSKNKISNETLKPLNVSHEQIITCISQNLPDKIQTTTRQVPYNYQTKIPDKEMIKSHASNDIQGNSSRGVNNYGKSIQGSAVTSNPLSPVSSKSLSLVSSNPKRPEEQTNEEWLQEHNNAEPKRYPRKLWVINDNIEL